MKFLLAAVNAKYIHSNLRLQPEKVRGREEKTAGDGFFWAGLGDRDRGIYH